MKKESRFKKALQRLAKSARHPLRVTPGGYRTGQSVPGEGVFLCEYAPLGRDGISLGKVFNVFAAPHDILEADGSAALLWWGQAVEAVAALEDLEGHKGASYASDAELLLDLATGSYHGQWVLPTSELLSGMNADGRYVLDDNLVSRHNHGDLWGTFTVARMRDPEGILFPGSYWSCTKGRKDPYAIWSAEICDGKTPPSAFLPSRAGVMRNCRPVRLVLKPS